jgi:hypothetical protein
MTKKQFDDFCAEHGVMIEVAEFNSHISGLADAPDGMWFYSSGCHCSCYNGERPWAKIGDLRAFYVDEINSGFIPCQDDECEVCEEL